MPVRGQLWYQTIGNVTPTDERVVRVNDDGTDQTTVATDAAGSISFKPSDIGLDTAAGFYFAIINNGSAGQSASLVRGSLAGGAPTVLINFATAGDPIVNALFIDTVNRKIYVGVQDNQGGTATPSGLRVYDYTATGTISASNLIVPTKAPEGGFTVFDPADFGFDRASNRLYFTELVTGGTNANGLFSLSLSNPTVVTQVVSQAQFPDNLSAGLIRDVEVDGSRGRVFFSTWSLGAVDDGNYNAAQNKIWTVATGSSGATATEVNLAGLPAGFRPDELAFDEVNNVLYINIEGTNTSNTDDVILVYQLAANGLSGTLLRTITPAAPTGTGLAAFDIGAMAFNALPTLTAVARASAASEQVAAVAVLASTPTIAESGGYLKGATVQITGNLTAGDVLSFAAAATSGTSIVAGAYNTATGTITLTGLDTVARYQTALANLLYATSSDNPTTFGTIANRTITVTLDDGSTNVPTGSANTSTVTFAVTGINDAPVNTVPGARTVLEDSVGNNGATPVNAITGLSIADPDAGTGVVRVTLSVVSGVLNIRTDSSGIIASEVIGNGTATLVITSTIAKINATFAATGAGGANGLTYTPTANFNGTDALTIVTNDLGLTGADPGNTGNGTSEADTDTVTINVTSVNDAPAGTDKTLTVIEDTPRTFTAADFGFSDIDGNTLQGVLITTVPTTGTLKFGSTAAPPGLFIAASDLGTLSFEPAANASGASYASFTFQVQDNGGIANGGVNLDQSPNMITLDVTAVNDAPLFAAAGAQPSYTENGAALAIATGVTLSDVDNANFNGGSLTLSFSNLVAGDQIGIDTNGTGITLSGATVLFNAVAIGTITAANTTTLSFAFNTAAATSAAVIALAQATVFLSSSDNPTAAQRSVVYTLVDGGGGAGTAAFTRTISVIPVDDPKLATADPAATAENTAVAGNVLNNDVDPDGGAASTVSAVNGGANVGTTLPLASGARVFVAADGSYTYDPNGAFNYLVAPGGSTGAQSTATDTFTYTVAGGGTATVTVTITGVAGAGDQLRGTAASETINGTGGADFIDIRQGGTDIVNAGNGDDLIFVGPGFDPSDQISGGIGYDQVGLFGSYSGSLGNVVGTEYLAVLSSQSTRFGPDGGVLFSYSLTTTDATVAGTDVYTVQANELVAGENLRFDGSAETGGGSFRIYAGKGIDTLIGGSGADGFFFGEGGRFTAADQVNGGGGNDQLGLRGNYAVTFTATTVTNVETIVLLSAFDAPAGIAEAPAYSYALVLDDATVASTQILTINAAQLRSNESASVNGAAETNGSFVFIGGQGADVFVGGSGTDTLSGGLGVDTLTGGNGNDIFMYRTAADSGPGVATRDTITDFTVGDRIDLSVIDAITGAGDDAFSFAAAFTNTVGQVRVVSLGGNAYLVEGDIDGNGAADFAINVTSDHALTAIDFIL